MFHQTVLASAFTLACIALSPSLQAQTAYPATLAGHAVLPAQSYLPVPKDAPADLQLSGKFTTAQRADAPGTVEGKSNGRP